MDTIISAACHAESAERAVLREVLVGALSPEYIDESLFTDAGCRAVCRAIRKCQSAGEPVDAVHAGLRGDAAAVSEIMASDYTVADPASAILRLRELAYRRRTAAAASALAEMAGDPSVGFETIVERAQDISTGLPQKRVDISKVFVPSWENVPASVEPLARFAGETKILSPGNIALIIASPGTGKTAICDSLPATTIKPESNLGIVLKAGATVTVIDTERSIENHWNGFFRCMRRCGVKQGEPIPEKIQFCNIRGLASLEERRQYLQTILATPPQVLILDGAADFVGDVNDVEQSTGFVSMLCSAVHNAGSGIICTIHGNPAIASQKARGHLGSELMRRAESVLIIEKVPGTNVRKITSDFAHGKNRNDNDDLTAYFRWSDTELMHVLCDAPNTSERKGKTVQDREKITGMMGIRAYRHGELVKLIMECCGLRERSARERVGDLIAVEMITKTPEGLYRAVEI